MGELSNLRVVHVSIHGVDVTVLTKVISLQVGSTLIILYSLRPLRRDFLVLFAAVLTLLDFTAGTVLVRGVLHRLPGEFCL